MGDGGSVTGPGWRVDRVRLAELRRSRTPDPAAALVPVRASTRVTFWHPASPQAGGEHDKSE